MHYMFNQLSYLQTNAFSLLSKVLENKTFQLMHEKMTHIGFLLGFLFMY